MVRRGLVPSREQARQAIEAGLVLVGGAVADKPARLVGPGEPLRLVGPPARHVSRGGRKLEAALDRFTISVEGRTALDAGGSTGGFTDCLLQRGARRVVAVDVGRAQLHERLLADARVTSLERTDIRRVDLAAHGAPFPLIVADLSFISLRLVLDALLGAAEPDADLVLLVKPQFEAGRAEVSKGSGVITDPAVWRRVLEEIRTALDERGAAIMGVMPSPIRGAEGNVEFLAHVRPSAVAKPAVADDAIAGAIAEALTAPEAGA